MQNLYPGEWYLRFTCIQCHSKQVLFPDLSNGTAPIQAIYEVTCTNCSNKASYDSDTIERYHHPEEAESVLSD